MIITELIGEWQPKEKYKKLKVILKEEAACYRRKAICNQFFLGTDQYIPKLLKLMGNKYRYGIINKNNLSASETNEFEMSDKQFQQLRDVCIAELEMSAKLHTTFNQEYHKNRLAILILGFIFHKMLTALLGF